MICTVFCFTNHIGTSVKQTSMVKVIVKFVWS